MIRDQTIEFFELDQYRVGVSNRHGLWVGSVALRDLRRTPTDAEAREVFGAIDFPVPWERLELDLVGASRVYVELPAPADCAPEDAGVTACLRPIIGVRSEARE
jgi:hypothetical protein